MIKYLNHLIDEALIWAKIEFWKDNVYYYTARCPHCGNRCLEYLGHYEELNTGHVCDDCGFEGEFFILEEGLPVLEKIIRKEISQRTK
jgi:predicted RNA-binding Zn-ribbon protein involved in translation (DUF1610 family)